MQERPLDIANDGGLFPRETLLAAVAEADWRDRSAPGAALVCLALGLALLALATPLLRPSFPVEVAWTASEGGALHLPHLLASLLARTSLGPERAWYVVAALGAGCALPVLVAATRMLAVGPRLALVVALVVATLPGSVIGAQLPVAYGFGVAASALVLAALLSRIDAQATYGAYVRRCLCAQALALWVHPESTVLAPATICALVVRGAGRKGAQRGLHPGVVVALALLALGAASGLVRGARLVALDSVLAELRAPFALAALAILPTLALAQLVLPTRGDAREEASAPGWLRAAVPMALVALAAGQVQPPFALGTPLVPLAALALANLANRRADPASAARLLALVAALSAAVLVALQLALRSWDRAPVDLVRRALTQAAPLAPEELDAEVRYIVRFRFGRPPEDLLPR
jgi:hypothetical protein